MFVERKVHNSVLFTHLVGWHAGAVSLLSSDITHFGPASLPLSDSCFVYILEYLTYLYKHFIVH